MYLARQIHSCLIEAISLTLQDCASRLPSGVVDPDRDLVAVDRDLGRAQLTSDAEEVQDLPREPVSRDASPFEDDPFAFGVEVGCDLKIDEAIPEHVRLEDDLPSAPIYPGLAEGWPRSYSR